MPSKFNLGDEVWVYVSPLFLTDDAVDCDPVIDMVVVEIAETRVRKKGTDNSTYKYRLIFGWDETTKEEDRVFASKEEATEYAKKDIQFEIDKAKLRVTDFELILSKML